MRNTVLALLRWLMTSTCFLLMMALALLLTGGGRISVDRDVLGWGAPPVSSPVGETPYD